MVVIFEDEIYPKEYILERFLKETKSFELIKVETTSDKESKIFAEFFIRKEEEK